MSLLGVGLALLAAVAYGVSDFVGGVASRRTSPWPVTLLATLGGLLGAIVLGLVRPGDPGVADLLWGVVAGIGGGAGTAFLYRGMAAGRMGVVGPLSAVGSALLPVVVGLGLGERPALLVWIGIVVALPGIWLVAQEPGQNSLADGLLDGLRAGAGFGLIFVGLGQVPQEAGWWPLTTSHLGSLVTITVLAVWYRESMRPTHAVHWWGIVAGLLGAAALLAYTLAVQTGLLTVAAVLTSLYPAFTVLLAALLLREHIWRPQWAGLVLCGVAVSLVAAG